MFILLSKQNSTDALLQEVVQVCGSGQARIAGPGVIECPDSAADTATLFPLAFCRQVLPHAVPASAASVREWVEVVTERLVATCADIDTPWAFHVFEPITAEEGVVHRRAQLVRDGALEFLRKKRRSLLRHLVQHEELPTQAVLVQVLLVTPETGYVSVSEPGPLPLTPHVRPQLGGHIEIPDDKSPPSRAFKKLAEVLASGWMQIGPRDSVVDLGASPGGWTHLAAALGASVTAVDRSPLAEHLMRSKRVTWTRADAFSWTPKGPVDLLLCDVISEPKRTDELIRKWIERQWCRRFIVTMKFKGEPDVPRIVALKEWLRGRTTKMHVTQLVNNRNEVTWVGEV